GEKQDGADVSSDLSSEALGEGGSLAEGGGRPSPKWARHQPRTRTTPPALTIILVCRALSRLENSTMTRKSRGWLIASAILSILVGLVALSSPLLFSVLIVQLLGAFAFASGLISLFLAIFGKDVAPRGFNALFALIRIGAGVALLSCVRSGLNLITLIFATYLTVEG